MVVPNGDDQMEDPVPLGRTGRDGISLHPPQERLQRVTMYCSTWYQCRYQDCITWKARVAYMAICKHT